MDFEVIVQPKEEVLDPQARAIRKSLTGLGFSQLKDLQVSKRFVLTIDAGSSDEAMEQAQKIAENHLANPVAERYLVRKVPV